MSEFLSSGRAIDLILLVVGVEAVLLLAVPQRPGRGMPPLDVLGQLLAGAMLLAALRCALTGADSRWTAAFLAASLPAHVFDLTRRWRGRADAPGRPRKPELR